MRSKRVLITGSNGFLGGAVASYLRSQGFVVVGLGRSADPVTGTADEYISVDLSDRNATCAALAPLRPVECVLHFAGLVSARGSFSNAPLYYAVNVGGFANLLIALRGPRYASMRVILASTGTVYGGLVAEDVSEGAILQPISPYAETKIAAEGLLTTEIEHGGLGSGTAFRMFGISGCFQGFVDRDSERMLPRLMRVAAGRAPFFQVNGDGSAVREMLDIRDFIVACEQCIDNGDLQYDVVNIGGGVRMSVKDAATLVRNASGRDLDVRFGAEAAEQKITTANITRARDMLGWKPSRLDPERMIGDAWRAFISSQ